MKGNPLVHFEKWFDAAVAAGEKHPDAMALATCSRKGIPSVRIVLYKGLSKGRSKGAFRLFTNYESRKGKELLSNPHAALTFHWKQLDRQIRIEGSVRKMSRAESEEYFHSRPRLSQIGAWASQQSRPIASREILIERVRHYELLFKDKPVALPPHWGGFLLVPSRIEFWQEGEFRLHDRFVFSRKKASSSWTVERLSP
ncbi:MAG: pyridoxamine 5'-phosphate oxidase [Oligoflexia bacterium]|jgi:pyridoxamine 5'-phosphate oxidase